MLTTERRSSKNADNVMAGLKKSITPAAKGACVGCGVPRDITHPSDYVEDRLFKIRGLKLLPARNFN